MISFQEPVTAIYADPEPPYLGEEEFICYAVIEEDILPDYELMQHMVEAALEEAMCILMMDEIPF